MRVVQISDTHHSTEYGHFSGNTEMLLRDLVQAKPDLIIHTGDVSMDGAGHVRDLELSRQWNDQLPAAVLSVPGNHDVGDLASFRADQPVNEARLRAWRDTFGPDRWMIEKSEWCLIGINAMLLGTGHAEEEEQFAWLASVLDDDRPIALFLHKPLCISRMDEAARGYWTVAPGPRKRITSLLTGKQVLLIASGHLHIQHQHTVEGVRHVWCPAASFVVGDSQEDLGGERRIGYVTHDFQADSVTSRFIRPDGARDLLLDPVRTEIYPD